LPIKVLLADDHALVRRGFRRLLEDEPDIQVIGEAGSGREAVDLALELRPDVVVMDYAMPELDGVQATLEIRRQLPDGAAIVMLSMHADEHYMRNAAQAGARAYLLKNAAELELVEAIREVAAGGSLALPVQLPSAEDGLEELTPREKQILQLIAQGNSNKDIAALLNLSVNTVSVHRNNLMHKMRIHRTAELVLCAVRHGLISPP
jgi:DNA-binding NarL/FixJ family response regulator